MVPVEFLGFNPMEKTAEFIAERFRNIASDIRIWE
jgi:hypothetical protein